MNTTLEYSTRVVQEGDRRCKKSTLNDLALGYSDYDVFFENDEGSRVYRCKKLF